MRDGASRRPRPTDVIPYPEETRRERRAEVVAPYSRSPKKGRGRGKPLPYGCAAFLLVMRSLERAATWGRPYKKSDPCPLIRLAFVRHLSLSPLSLRDISP